MENRFNPKPVKIASNIRIDPNASRKTPSQIREEMFKLKHPNTNTAKVPDFKKRIDNLNRFKKGL